MRTPPPPIAVRPEVPPAPPIARHVNRRLPAPAGTRCDLSKCRRPAAYLVQHFEGGRGWPYCNDHGWRHKERP